MLHRQGIFYARSCALLELRRGFSKQQALAAEIFRGGELGSKECTGRHVLCPCNILQPGVVDVVRLVCGDRYLATATRVK